MVAIGPGLKRRRREKARVGGRVGWGPDKAETLRPFGLEAAVTPWRFLAGQGVREIME